MAVKADDVIAMLGLSPHPEGGAYIETWRADAESGQRSAGSAIYFLLREGEVSKNHRIDSAEVWHFYAGAPLELTIDGEQRVLGSDLATGQRPQITVPPHAWQTARSLGAWTLVGCTVSPAFEFEFFEMEEA